MRQNKLAITFLTPLAAFALISAWFFDNNEQVFWSNVLLGVFGSGFLTVLVSIINYANERRHTLETFWSYSKKFVNNCNQYPIDGSLIEKADAIILMSTFDYLILDDAYGDMDFIFKNKSTRHKIYTELYEPTKCIRQKISVSSGKIRILRREAPNNVVVLENYVREIDDLLIKSETEEICNSGKHDPIKYTTKCNKIHEQYVDRLNGFYYTIMYPIRGRRK